jgi:hypothetical protein
MAIRIIYKQTRLFSEIITFHSEIIKKNYIFCEVGKMQSLFELNQVKR